MPPSTHYLNLLNLNGVDDQPQHVDFTNEDIAKELELFTNTSFSELEAYYPQSHDVQSYDNQLLDPSSLQATLTLPEKPKMQSTTMPRNQRPHFQPVMDTQIPMQNYPAQYEASYDYNIPLKRTAEQAGHDQTAATTPASTAQADEEDKRRRNTAASARFRIKKKQREQALLESAKQMNDKNAALEARIKELEMENKFLKSMLKPVSPSVSSAL